MKKYPLPLARGKDCKILMHIGDKICSMLDKRLDEHIAAVERSVSRCLVICSTISLL